MGGGGASLSGFYSNPGTRRNRVLPARLGSGWGGVGGQDRQLLLINRGSQKEPLSRGL